MNWLITCPKCGGSGTVKMKASLTNINTLASGEVWFECMNCNGKGMIVKPEDNGQTLDRLYGKIVPLNVYEAQQAELAALRQQLATARAALEALFCIIVTKTIFNPFTNEDFRRVEFTIGEELYAWHSDEEGQGEFVEAVFSARRALEEMDDGA